MTRTLILLVALGVAAGPVDDPRQQYVERYAPLAVSEMQRTGVPASITLAQALLESDAGRSELAVYARNHFGIKCHSGWTGEKYYHDDDQVQECFRSYASVEDSYRAHSEHLLAGERYQGLFDLDPTDYKAWARGLRQAGYATDPAYADKLIRNIESLELYRYDQPSAAPALESGRSLPLVETESVLAGTSVPLRQSEAKERLTVSLTRPLGHQNGVPFVRTVEGDSWQSLADAYGLFLRQILKYNDLESASPLEPGTQVYLSRKKGQSAPEYGRYIVDREGLTLWDISQMFGIRLGRLRQFNGIIGNGPIPVGDTVLLKKF